MFIGPVYLQKLVKHVNETVSRSNVRSSYSNIFIKTCTRTKFAERAFSYAGLVWNVLPAELRSIKSKDIFKRRLKTHHFSILTSLA